MTDEIRIDGRSGEGGGQVLRTSLALSALTGRPLAIDHVRGGRAKAGLLRQHLTAVNAAAEICGAEVRGAELRSTTLRFRPGPIRAGRYAFAVGSAGSACLVAQTVLPMLLFADGPSELRIEGGTHNPRAPTFHDLEQVFLPLLARAGVPGLATWIDGYGFYPAGGGCLQLTVSPWEAPVPLVLEQAGAEPSLRAWALVAGEVPKHVAARELRALRDALPLTKADCAPRSVPSPGPGNVLQVLLDGASPELFTSFGSKGVRAEVVASRLAAEVRAHLGRGVPVGEYLADQLLLPLALGAGGRFVTGRPSLHFTTNVEVIERFLGPCVRVQGDARGNRFVVDVRGRTGGKGE
ncbi:MAG: RNA 3'-terminal phosphate cyclase [Myxococcota bacterium]